MVSLGIEAYIPSDFYKAEKKVVHILSDALFSDTPKGADASAMVYTMVEMAKAHDLNIYKYLNYLLEQLPGTIMSDEGRKAPTIFR